MNDAPDEGTYNSAVLPTEEGSPPVMTTPAIVKQLKLGMGNNVRLPHFQIFLILVLCTYLIHQRHSELDLTDSPLSGDLE